MEHDNETLSNQLSIGCIRKPIQSIGIQGALGIMREWMWSVR